MSSALPSYEEASAQVASYATRLRNGKAPAIEQIDLKGACGRVLAEPLFADQDQPPFSRSTRDGFAVRAEDASRHSTLPVAGLTHAGEAPAGPLSHGVAWEIMTGAPVPAGADAVVMLEHVERGDEGIRLHGERKIGAGDNVVTQGAQSRRGDEMVGSGAILQPAQLALAATCGYAKVKVYRRPRVAILATGDELVAVDAEPGPGQIRNSNGPMLAALVAQAGGEPWVLAAARDTAEHLDGALREAVGADLLLISGGVSAGKFDLVEPALARMGAEFHFTGVKIQPGKPLVFGELEVRESHAASRTLPFFGLPGNPISSACTFLLFAAPVLAALAGANELGPHFGMAQLARETDRKAKPGLTRFLPARCDFNLANGQMPQVATVSWHGSGDLPAFARSNCFLVVPEQTGSLDSGALVRILML